MTSRFLIDHPPSFSELRCGAPVFRAARPGCPARWFAADTVAVLLRCSCASSARCVGLSRSQRSVFWRLPVCSTTTIRSARRLLEFGSAVCGFASRRCCRPSSPRQQQVLSSERGREARSDDLPGSSPTDPGTRASDILFGETGLEDVAVPLFTGCVQRRWCAAEGASIARRCPTTRCHRGAASAGCVAASSGKT